MIIYQDYEKLKFLGSGSFAKIYKVRHKELGYVRAIKVLDQEDTDDESGSKIYNTFLKECRLLLQICNGGHPNILKIYQPRKVEGRSLVEMDYIDGCTLNDYVKEKKGFIPYKEVMDFVRQIGGALAYCHSGCYKYMMSGEEAEQLKDGTISVDDLKRKYAVAHNDLHSNNIMRRSLDGAYMLLDFGLAVQDGRAVKSSSRRNGAVEYMAPEKWDGQQEGSEPVDERKIDVYGFGILMYEMLAGEVPFRYDPTCYHNNDLACLNAVHHMHKEVTPAAINPLRKKHFEEAFPERSYSKDYPSWLEDMIMKCLEKDPADRYKDVQEFYDELMSRLDSEESLLEQRIAELEKDLAENRKMLDRNRAELEESQKMLAQSRAELEKRERVPEDVKTGLKGQENNRRQMPEWLVYLLVILLTTVICFAVTYFLMLKY